jgi:hypothetical protein
MDFVQNQKCTRRLSKICVKHQRYDQSLSIITIQYIPSLLTQLLHAESRRLNSPVILCSSKAVRTADAFVADMAAAVVAFAIEEAGNEAAMGDMMRKDSTSRWKDINNDKSR